MNDDYSSVYQEAGRENNLDPDLIRAVHQVESGGSNDKDNAVSETGDLGRGQFQPRTARELGIDPGWAPDAIHGTARYLRQNFDKLGNPTAAVGAYNTGPGGAGSAQAMNYAGKVYDAYTQIKAREPEPEQVAEAPPESKRPNISSQIETARKSGYTDQQIGDYLRQSKTWGPKFDQARQAGYGDDAVYSHLGLKPRRAPLPRAEQDQPSSGEHPQSPPGTPPSQDEMADEYATRPTTPTIGGALQAINEKASSAYTSTPPLINPESTPGQWLSQHGMSGLTQPIVPLAAINAGLAGAGEAAVQATKRYVGEAAARGVGEVVDYAMTGMPEVAGMASGQQAGHEIQARAKAMAEGRPAMAEGAPAPVPEGAAATPAPAAPPKEAAPTPARPQTIEQAALDELEKQAAGAPEEGHAIEALQREAGVEPQPQAPVEPPPKPAEPTRETQVNPAEITDPTRETQVNPAEIAAPAEPPEPEKISQTPPETGFGIETAEPPQRGGPSPFEKLPREPMRLNEWLRQNGGIQDTDGDLKAILGGTRGRPGLINKRGATPDDAALAAWQAGYLPDAARPDIDALKDAIREDHTAGTTGTKRYSDQDYDRVQEYQAAIDHNDEIDRLSTQHGIDTRDKSREQFFDELHDRLSTEEQAQEIRSQEAAFLAAQKELERGAAGIAPEPYNARDFYGQSQARSLKDLEDEHRQETSAAATQQRPEGAAEPARAAPPEAGGEGIEGPGGHPAGDAGRGEAVSPETDLLGRPVAEPRGKAAPEPTIRTDPNQIAMPGTEPSAVQAQAARDAQGRGALQAEVPQKKADEGLFKPDTSGQGTLYSFPGALFDPAAWRRLLSPLLNRGTGYEFLSDKKGLASVAGQIKAGLAPTSLRGGKDIEYPSRRLNADLAQAKDQALHALEDVRTPIDRLPQLAQRDITYRAEMGQKQAAPQLQPAIDTLRGVQDFWMKKVQSLGPEFLASTIDNYMGHVWQNWAEWTAERRANQGLQTHLDQQGRPIGPGGKSITGSGSFMKQRIFPTQEDGIAAGLRPVTYNPIDLQMIKIFELQKMYYGTKYGDEMINNGIATFVRNSQEAQSEARMNGLMPLEDKYFKARKGQTEFGGYWAPEPLARVFNNYVSTGWQGNPLYNGIRQTNNMLNALQLFWPGFHAAFVINDTMTSKAALAIDQMAKGKPLRALGTLAQTPISLPQAMIRGSQLRREWLDPGSTAHGVRAALEGIAGYPQSEVAGIVNALKEGGGRMAMPDFFKSSASGAFYKTLKDFKNPASPFYSVMQMYRDAPPGLYNAAVRLPMQIVGRLFDTVMQPVMGYLVPRAKMAVFGDMASDWLRDNSHASAREVQAAMTKIVDSVDNRLGQLNYDNLFWNKALKDLAFVSQRSVGWNLGTLREIGGGGVDAAALARDVLSGNKPEWTRRMSYSIAMPAISAIVGSVITYLATGHGPQEWRDLYAPQTGGMDENGNPRRVTVPGYMKDILHAAHDFTGTILGKTAPLLSLGRELFVTGKDYYDRLIYNPLRDQSAAAAYADYIIGQQMPFTARALLKGQTQNLTPAEQAMTLFGFAQAPQWIANPERAAANQFRQQRKDMRRREPQGTMHIFTSPRNATP